MKQNGLQGSGLEHVVLQFREKIEKLLNFPVQVILYGSYARGENSPHHFFSNGSERRGKTMSEERKSDEKPKIKKI